MEGADRRRQAEPASPPPGRPPGRPNRPAPYPFPPPVRLQDAARKAPHRFLLAGHSHAGKRLAGSPLVPSAQAAPSPQRPLYCDALYWIAHRTAAAAAAATDAAIVADAAADATVADAAAAAAVAVE
ncbi:hypothetical protein PLESTF_001929900 [Pleodorina starrii]|nr:hypothetical protein PLESTF_001929900 [Pleodorina starrii]